MTVQTDHPPLVRLPVDEQYDQERFVREYVKGEPTEEDKATVAVYGYCRPFCANEGPTSGQLVSEHTPWCESVLVFIADGLGVDNTHIGISGSVVAPYHHGVYRREDTPLNHAELLAVRAYGNGIEPDNDDVEHKTIYLTAGDVRRLAAALAKAADTMDKLDRDISVSPRIREEHGH